VPLRLPRLPRIRDLEMVVRGASANSPGCRRSAPAVQLRLPRLPRIRDLEMVVRGASASSPGCRRSAPAVPAAPAAQPAILKWSCVVRTRTHQAAAAPRLPRLRACRAGRAWPRIRDLEMVVRGASANSPGCRSSRPPNPRS
jgi:hypothetical protein